jgi:hypothetical protein
VLEPGCGPGFLAEQLLQNGKISRYTLVDFSPHMLELSRERLAGFKDRTVFFQRDFKKKSWTAAIPADFDLVTGKTGASVIQASSDVVRVAVQGIVEVGGDVGLGAKGIIIGVLRGTKQTGTEAFETISATAGAVVKGTSEVAGDVGRAAKGAVEGAIAGAKELSVDATEAASAAATGAVKAAGEIGSGVAEQVRNAVTGTIAGVKVVLKEPFKK